MQTGEPVGWTMSGNPYVMPERGCWHDPKAWGGDLWDHEEDEPEPPDPVITPAPTKVVDLMEALLASLEAHPGPAGNEERE